MGPLHYHSSRSDFGFKFAEIFIFENRLPAINESSTPHISDTGSKISAVVGVPAVLDFLLLASLSFYLSMMLAVANTTALLILLRVFLQ
jgi:hypothetical protein